MNRDAEAVNDLLAWLFQDPSLTNDGPSGEGTSPGAGVDGSDTTDLHLNNLMSSAAEESNSMRASLRNPHFSSLSNSQSEGLSRFDIGEIPAVQDRFHALLKRRLRAEIARKPPLFPWESESCEYESERNDVVAADFVPAHVWTQPIHARIPVPMSDQLLVDLLQRCQALVASSVQRGAQLVKAVESLFPGESQTLNHLAGMVLVSPVRGYNETVEETSGFPVHYDAATPLQQMALSLIAAREIMDELTLTVSAESPVAVRRWTTDQGMMSIQALFEPHAQRLRVEAQLPGAGKLQLKSGTALSAAHRATAGSLSVELFDLEMERPCSLDVQLENASLPSLTFAIQLECSK